MYVDLHTDESYTPFEISIKVGLTRHDLQVKCISCMLPLTVN